MFRVFCKILAGASFATYSSLAFSQVSNSDETIEEIVVTADFYGSSLSSIASSVSVVGEADIEKRQAEHLDSVLNSIPNVNFSTGSSRGKYIQIRGIGERSQFVDPINPSVGVFIDGFDMSGIAGAATTLDVEQLEVLRGPQGTNYGSSAIAGLINIKSNEPSETFYTKIKAGIGNYGTYDTSIVNSNTLSNGLGYRFAIGQAISDGYAKNTFLNVDDTQEIDEITAKANLTFSPNLDQKLQLNLLYVDVNNGYDGFSLDNSPRSTQSDEPGQDLQESVGIGVTYDFNISEGLRVESMINTLQSDIVYSFDEDWTDTNICIRNNCDFAYASFRQFERENDNHSADVRLIADRDSKLKFVSGLFYQYRSEDLNDSNIFDFNLSDGLSLSEGVFSSEVDFETVAVYGQADSNITDALKVSAGLRLENRTAEYVNSSGRELDFDDTAAGGKISIEANVNQNALIYASVNHGFKSGGFNSSPVLPTTETQTFDTEQLTNYEVGYKGFDGEMDLSYSLVAFYQDRIDPQFKQYLVIRDGSDFSFNEYLVNADAASNYGIEMSIDQRLENSSRRWLSLGILQAKYDDFESFSQFFDGPEDQAFDLASRDQPHAPNWQIAAGTELSIAENVFWDFDIEGKDKFYFSSSNNTQSEPYLIANTALRYTNSAYTVTAWVRNLGNHTIQTRGFFFGNDPRDGYTRKPYYQFGAPRTFGVSASVEF